MSAILSADDLNDFISPGVACIKPIETLPAVAPAQPTSNENEVILDGHGAPTSASNSNGAGAAPAEISLTDCLACSGCVTSAEAVLVSLQSHAEVLSTLDAAPALRVVGPDAGGNYGVEGLGNEDAKLFVASVAPQTRASLAAACGRATSLADAGHMLENLLRGESGLPSGGKWNNGFTWVVDTNAARDATLVLAADEVLLPGTKTNSSNAAGAAPTAPILASSCPGWVCYAEKTHPHVLPHLSRVKSPQALMGTMLKTTLSRRLGIPPERIWHVAVMPCFDKKLEASREELQSEVWAGKGQTGKAVRDVDCVITSKEILMLAESRGLNFFDIPKTLSTTQPTSLFPDARLRDFLFSDNAKGAQQHAAGTSGGLLHYTLQRRAAMSAGSTIQVNRGRNADVVEYLIVSDGTPVFKAARYYGFRNIQNLVRKLRPAKPSRMPGGKPFGSARRPAGKVGGAALDYGYVEVMACPGGCTNGGGQVKVDDPVIVERKQFAGKPGPQEQKNWLAEVDEAYFSGSDDALEPNDVVKTGGADGDNDEIDGVSRSRHHGVMAYWSDMVGIGIGRLAYTSFREVISDVGKDTATDTEKVVQLAGKIGGGW